ncbi:MAG: winged helix-turn-helix domain-containing protein [Vicinamibacterales bacterium]
MAARYRWDDFLLDLDAYRLERMGSPLALEPKAFNLLALMVRRPGHLFTKQELFDAVWPDTAVTDHALTRVVAQLRRVLGDEAHEARYIETVPTRGYRWIRPVDELGAAAAPTRRGVLSTLAASILLAPLLVALVVWMLRDGPSSALGTRSREPGTTSAAGGKRPYDVQWPVQVTTHGGLDLQPALSPQGDAVAYASDATGAFEIYVRAFGGTARESPLTSDEGQNVQPAWSPDGRLLAYHSYRHGGIWVVPARGGVPRQVAPAGSHPAWAPDGQRIAFQSDEHTDVTPSAFGAQNGSTIWIVDADGGSPRQVTRTGQPAGGHAAPAWSRDARYLAFAVFEGGPDNGIWVLDLETREAKAVENGAGLFELVFAPDGSAIYAAGGDALIARLPFDPATGTVRGPRETIPVPGVPGVRGLSISADGRRLAFAGIASSSQIWAQRIGRDGSPAGPPRALTSDTSRRNSIPTIAPNGSKVAYISTRSGELPNVWVMDADGRNGLQVTSDEAADWKARWFPDSRRLAYLSNRDQVPGIWSVDIETRREELLFDVARARRLGLEPPAIKGRLGELDLAPSVTRAAFSLMVPPAGRRAIYVTGLDTFAPRAVTDGTSSIGYPAWSPDERRLAVEIKDGSSTHAGVIELQTGALRQLTSERGQTWVRSWSPDGRRMAVAALRDGVWSLRWIDAESGRQGAMTAPEPPRAYVRYPDWSPRGDLVLFERGELRGNIWMLTLQ